MRESEITTDSFGDSVRRNPQRSEKYLRSLIVRPGRCSAEILFLILTVSGWITYVNTA